MEMIQSSSCSTPMIWKYDVFVSFRGEDTRNNFADHLFAALHGKGFVAFRDDTKLPKGENISTELLQAIEGSQILIVLFSKNYVFSTWCLQELAKIADCIELKGKTVLPIFYDVTPSEVRKQSGDYGKAFVEHEERFKEELEKVQSWREALAQVASLSGWDLRDKPQNAEIGKIIKRVAHILRHKYSTLPVSKDLVGIQSQVEELEQILVLDSNDDDVRAVGICGMGGVGKTTLATSLFKRISYQFDMLCFIDDTSKLFREHGPMEAQKQILHQALDEENLQLHHFPMVTNLMQTRLRHEKALLVLDNVDEWNQLDKLAIQRESLHSGSRIVIISRDEHILRQYPVDEVYKVQPLNWQDALQLFCRKAFKSDAIRDGYVDLTNEVLRYVGGLPLAINVLGSFLCGRDVSEWKSALIRHRKNPEERIMDVLRLSFDALTVPEREIFLDIACFFDRKPKEYVMEVLDARGFYPEISMKVLIEKSLLAVNKFGKIKMHDLLKELGMNIVREISPEEPRKWSRLWDYMDFHNVMLENMGKIKMHDLLKELGMNIVREISPEEPRKWSRLWDYMNFHNVMLENMATENLAAIVIDAYGHEFLERADYLSKMSHLKLLILKNVNFSGNLNHLSNELRYLHWKEYPFKCLPQSFQADKLVELILPHSSINKLWEDLKRPLYKLRRMDLSHSRCLIKIPDFRKVPNLEFLILEGCTKLVRIDQSIGILKKLVLLNLNDCKNLVSIPNSIFHLSSLEELNLSGCSKLLSSSTQWLTYSSLCKILKFPPIHCMYSRRLQDSVGSLLPCLSCFPCLRRLDLSFCNLVQIPDAIGWLHSLVTLKLGGNNFVTLPSSIKELSKLRHLSLEHCKQWRHLPELPSRRETWTGWFQLYIFDCPKLCLTECFYSMSFSWLIQHFKVHMKSSFTCDGFENVMVIPGAQIPRWFSQQNVGSSICIDSSPIMQNPNWIGVVVCVTFVAHDDPTNLAGPSSCHGLLCYFEPNPSGYCYDIPILIRKGLVTVEFDHLVLLYISRKHFIDHYLNEGVSFLPTIDDQPRGLHVEVKACGYHWVFKEDLEQLIPTMEHCGNSSVVEGNFLTYDSPDDEHGN